MEVEEINGGDFGINDEAAFKRKLQELTSKDIAVFDELGALPIKNVHAESYIVVVCLEGKGKCLMDGKNYEINKNDLIIGHPDLFVENAMVSIDFKCEGLVISPTFFESIFFLGGNHWEAALAVKKQPVLHMREDEVERALFNLGIIRKKLTDTKLPHHKEALKLLLHSMIYEFYDFLSPKLNLDMDGYGYSASEILFKRFVRMLADSSPCRHEVGYYADKLCVSRKHLSAVCKQQSGKTASEHVNERTVNYINQMLRFSDKTIKEIANDTGFENLSFFGKYVKRELGVSPRNFRLQK